MKKSLIAGAGVAALGMAVLPLAGVFADVTDTVRITINSACSIGQTSSTEGAGKTLTETMANGATKTWDADGSAGGTIKVTCNASNGWNVKAVGSSDSTNKTKMIVTSGSGTPIDTATPSGTINQADASFWAMKVAAHDSGSGISIESDYAAFHAVPATATKVASGTGAISEGQIDTGYQVHVSLTQEAATYQGMVTYTIASGTN